jgi:hypothetical protein
MQTGRGGATRREAREILNNPPIFLFENQDIVSILLVDNNLGVILISTFIIIAIPLLDTQKVAFIFAV